MQIRNTKSITSDLCFKKCWLITGTMSEVLYIVSTYTFILVFIVQSYIIFSHFYVCICKCSVPKPVWFSKSVTYNVIIMHNCFIYRIDPINAQNANYALQMVDKIMGNIYKRTNFGLWWNNCTKLAIIQLAKVIESRNLRFSYQ